MATPPESGVTEQPATWLRRLTVRYNLVAAALVTLFALAFLDGERDDYRPWWEVPTAYDSLLTLLTAALAVWATVSGWRHYRRRLPAPPALPTLDKLRHYKPYFWRSLRWPALTALLCVLLLYLTGDQRFALIFLVPFFWVTMRSPTRRRVWRDVPLTHDESLLLREE